MRHMTSEAHLLKHDRTVKLEFCVEHKQQLFPSDTTSFNEDTEQKVLWVFSSINSIFPERPQTKRIR